MFTVIINSLSTAYDHSGAKEILTLNLQHHQQLYMLPPTACVWQHCTISCTLSDSVLFFIRPIWQFQFNIMTGIYVQHYPA
jgi:hypothetical protein